MSFKNVLASICVLSLLSNSMVIAKAEEVKLQAEDNYIFSIMQEKQKLKDENLRLAAEIEDAEASLCSFGRVDIGDLHISKDTVWTADNRYYISGTVIVDPGVTLTIEPGTIIFITTEDACLIIDGTLNAIGTENKTIHFAGSLDLDEGEYWKGIVLRSKVGNKASTLEHLCIFDAVVGLTIEVENDNLIKSLFDLTFFDSITGMNILTEGLAIVGCGHKDIILCGIEVNASNTCITDYHGTNSKTGINISADGAFLQYSSFYSNEQGVIINAPNANLYDISISHNQNGLFIGASDTTVEFSDIDLNTENGIIISAPNITITDSNIENNGSNGFLLEEGCAVKNNGIKVNRNSISNNADKNVGSISSSNFKEVVFDFTGNEWYLPDDSSVAKTLVASDDTHPTINYTPTYLYDESSYVTSSHSFDSNEKYLFSEVNADVRFVTKGFDSCDVIVAVYDKDGVLKEAFTRNVPISSKYTSVRFCEPLSEPTNDFRTIKVFIWDSLGTLKPLV